MGVRPVAEGVNGYTHFRYRRTGQQKQEGKGRTMATNKNDGLDTRMTQGETVLSKIHVTKGFNIREDDSKSFDDESIADLAKDIRVNGQYTALIVKVRKDGDYDLVAGHRRLRAIQLIEAQREEEYKEAKAKAKEAGKDAKEVDAPGPWPVLISITTKSDEELEIINANENLHREDITDYEWAKKFMHLKKTYGLSAAGIAGRLHSKKLSVSSVNNFTRALEMAPPSILKAWKEGTYPVREVLKHLAKTKEEQLAALDTFLGVKADATGEGGGDAEGEGNGADKPAKVRAISRDKMGEVMSWLNKKSTKEEMGDEWVKGARACLRYVMGDAKSIQGVYPPKEEEKEGKGAEASA
jgi:ParB-like chromosome segregation protein Spo0J